MVWIFMVSCATLNACNETDDESAALEKTATAEFIKQATATDLFEITAGMMSEDKGQSDAITSFGQQLVHVHSRTSEALSTMARRKSVEIPEVMDVDKKRVVSQLDEKQGKAFDESFAATQITAHQEAIGLYEKADKDIKDPEVQAFVDQLLPVLKEHLAEIQKIQTQLVKK